MEKLATLPILIMCLPIIAFGAQIYGSLRINNASVGKGVLVRIKCGEVPPYDALTDDYGSYIVALRASKKCELMVYYGDQWSKPFDVYPYEDPVRYDFDLLKENNGIFLKRR